MSTNYYIKGYSKNDEDNIQWHIGKRWGIGNGKTGFMWAINPICLGKRLNDEEFYNPDKDKSIISDYGEEFSLSLFLKNIVGKCEIIEDKHIGTKFS